MAVVMGALKNLKDNIPEAKTTILCHHRQEWETLENICIKYDAKIAGHPWFREHGSRVTSLYFSFLPALAVFSKCILGRIFTKFGIHVNRLISESDLILDLNIDSLNDNYGIFLPLWTLSNIVMCKLAGQPVMIWAAGIGQFNKWYTRWLTKNVLNHVNIIFTREEVSKLYLNEIGIHKPGVFVTADHAFYMDAVSSKRVKEILAKEHICKGQCPLIGISPAQSNHVYAFPGIKSTEEKYQRNLDVMVNLIDYLIRKYGAQILLIPHVLQEPDDRIISRNIEERVKEKRSIKILSGEYAADELKGVIGVCDLFIGCRMHPTIGATSLSVPTVAVVYGQKWNGIIGDMMGQSDYMVEIGKYNPDKFLNELQAKVDSAWVNREKIKNELTIRAEIAKKRAVLNSSLIQSVIQKRKDQT
jgi:colanic acid/amylovoran biosynthesis protein